MAESLNTTIDVAHRFAAALDAEDYAAALALLAGNCVYHLGDTTILGAHAIVDSYRANGDAARKRFDAIEYTSSVESTGPATATIAFTDRVRRGTLWHEYRCRQHVRVDRLIVEIRHEELPGERARLKQFETDFMLTSLQTPLIRLGNLFPQRAVLAKCEFLAPSGCFKIRGAVHLLEQLTREGKKCELIVPSAGNTAVGAAVGAKSHGYTMTGVVPKSIARAKDEKLRGLGVELVKIDGGGSELLRTATELAKERGGYFVHPHLDPLWTDGYQPIAAEILQALPDCRSLVIPVGGGGLLMGLLAYLRANASLVRLFGVEPYNYPKYAQFSHARSDTIADGLKLEKPHPSVQQAIAEAGISVSLVEEADIRTAMRDLYDSQGLVVEPSSAITLAFVKSHEAQLPEPVCVVLTGENIAREDHRRLIANTLE